MTDASLLRRRAPALAVLTIAIVLAGVIAWALPALRSGPPRDLPFPLLDGRRISIAELRGQPTLVTFWATNCAPCVEELPDLIKLYQELRPRGLQFIAVAMPYDPPLNVQNFVLEHAVPYPVALDVDGAIARAFGGVPYIPVAFLLDPDGRILYRLLGKLDVAQAIHALTPFLDDPPQ